MRHASELAAGLIGHGAVIRRNEQFLALTSFADAITWLPAVVERALGKRATRGCKR